MDEEGRELLATEVAELNTMVGAWGLALGIMATTGSGLEQMRARELAEALETDVAMRLRAFSPWTRRGATRG